MRLDDLFEQDIPQAGDIIEVEFGDFVVEGIFQDIDEDGEMTVWFDEQGNDYITELVPLIPAAVAAGGAAWSAYDAYQAKKAYDKGEISKAQLAKQIGTDAALTAVGGGAAKLAAKGFKAAKAGINKLRGKDKPEPKKSTAKKSRKDRFDYDAPSEFGQDNAMQRAVATATAVENISKTLEDDRDDIPFGNGDGVSNCCYASISGEPYGGHGRCSACGEMAEIIDESKSQGDEDFYEAEYQGREVKLNKPMRGDVKKFKVYVKDPKTGNVKKVNFGHGGTSAKRKTMRIKKSNPARRKSFRARHNCDNPGPKTKARYWSCRAW